VEALFHGRSVDTGDGLRVEDRGGWVQVRISATEPMIRVIAEDRSKDRARAKADEILHEIELLIR
jgi:phosphomannomutase